MGFPGAIKKGVYSFRSVHSSPESYLCNLFTTLNPVTGGRFPRLGKDGLFLGIFLNKFPKIDGGNGKRGREKEQWETGFTRDFLTLSPLPHPRFSVSRRDYIETPSTDRHSAEMNRRKKRGNSWEKGRHNSVSLIAYYRFPLMELIRIKEKKCVV